uniref:Si:dkey-10p5.10 n=1 Tax=Amphilophus citrinellus TaxID=61819 RepID=A0A3Q0QZT3_AMPCI
AAGPISSGCGGRPSAGGPLNGLSHHEGAGGRSMGGVEHRGLHL